MTRPRAPASGAPTPEPIVEGRLDPSGRTDAEELAYRLRQQSVLAEFGVAAMQAGGLDELLDEAVRRCAEGMRARLCKVLEYLPDERRLLLRAGVGWGPGVVGTARLRVDQESPAGFAFHTGKAVISNHLGNEQRFRTPRLLAEYGVTRAINVLVVAGTDQPWGVLEVDSPDEGKFDEADVAFMQGFAHLLGVAIERERAAAALAASEERSRRLFDAVPDAYLIVAPDFTIEAANEARLRITKSRREEIVGKPLFEAFPDNPDDLAASGVRNLRASLQRVLETRAPDRMGVQRFDIRRPDGQFEERWWRPFNVPVLGPDGEIRHIIHHVEDVTAETLEQHRAAGALAREAESRAMIENAPQKMWVNRPDGSVEHFNAAWRAYTGHSVSADGLSWTEVAHPDDRAKMIEARAAAIAARRPYVVEVRLRRQSDGAYRRHLGEVAPIAESGEVTAWIGVAFDIEDVRRAEAAARQAQEESRFIVDSATDYAILTTDLSGVITSWSLGAAAIFGYAENEILGRSYDLLFTPEDREADVPARELGTAREEGIAPDRRWHLRKNGVRVFMNGSTRLLRDDSGMERGFMKIARDDTERRQANDIRRANEARYRAILDTAVDAIVTIDERGIIQELNLVTERLFGYRVEELIGGSIQRLMPEAYAAGHAEAMETYRRTGVRRVIGIGREVEGRRKDGSLVPLELAIGEWRDAEGRRFFTGFMRDITERKRAEQALRESEEQFRTMAESIPQLAWIAHADGRRYWFNRRWYDYTGTTLEEVRDWRWESVHHPEHVEQAVRGFREAMRAGEPWQDVFPLRGADGRWRWFLTRAEPLRDASGHVVRWFGTNTDITERREAEELQKMLGQEMSHRLKNSLGIVSSLLILQARTLGDIPRRALEEAAMRVQTVARVHDQLWRQTNAREIDLAAFLFELCEAIGASSPRHRTICRFEPAIVSTDVAVPVGLLVNELVTNAYKYAYPLGQEGEVHVIGVRCGDGRYQLEISDKGQGLPEGFSLCRTKGSFGMRVVTAFATQLGAEIKAENAEPGARFTLLLPRQAVPPDLPARPDA